MKISLNSVLLDFLIFSISLLEFRDFRKTGSDLQTALALAMEKGGKFI